MSDQAHQEGYADGLSGAQFEDRDEPLPSWNAYAEGFDAGVKARRALLNQQEAI